MIRCSYLNICQYKYKYKQIVGEIICGAIDFKSSEIQHLMLIFDEAILCILTIIIMFYS